MAIIQKPQEISLRAGSSGTKADININSAQFRAISNLAGTAGNELIQAKQERQKLKDNAAFAEYQSTAITAKAGLDAAFEEEQDTDARQGILEESITSRNAKLGEITKGMSKGQREALGNSAKVEDAKLRAQYGARILQDDIASDNAIIVSYANNLVRDGDLEGAIAQVDNLNISEGEKAEQVSRLERFDVQNQVESIETAASLSENTEEVDLLIEGLNESNIPKVPKERTMQKLIKRKSSLFNQNESFIMKELALEADEASRGSDIDAMADAVSKSTELSPKAKAQMNQKFQRRKLSIRNSDVSTLKANLRDAQTDFNLVLKGEIVSELQLSDSYDSRTRDAVITAIESRGGPRGTNSSEYIDLMEEIQGFDGTGFFNDDLTAEHKKNVISFLEDPQNSTEAKLQVASESIASLSIDVGELQVDTYLGVSQDEDGNQILEWRDDNLELDEAQGVAIRNFGFTLDQLILGANQKGDFKDSVISGKSAMDLFMFIHQEDTIAAFAGIEDPEGTGADEFKKKYDEVFQSKFNEAINSEAKKRFRDRIQSVNQGIRDLR